MSKKQNYVLQGQLASLSSRCEPSTQPWLSAFEGSYYKNKCMYGQYGMCHWNMSKSTTNNSKLAFVHHIIQVHFDIPYFSIDNAHPKLMYTPHVHFLRI